MALVPTQGLVDFTNHLGSPIRANAGAGTGKTTAITERVANLVESAVPPRNILIMTFSRKAAESLRVRIRRKIGIAAEDLTIGTFHSVGAQEIRRLQKQGKKSRIMDENDATILWEQAFDEVPCPMPREFAGHAAEFQDTAKKSRAKTPAKPEKAWRSSLKKCAGILQELWSEQLNQHQGKDDFATRNVPRLLAASRFAQKSARLVDFKTWAAAGLENYRRLKLEHNALDYDDVLNLWAEKLHADPGYRDYVLLRWQHVLIDEYQDTNHLQEHIITGLNTENLTVVGDPSQCIYAFRKAVPRLMIEFHLRHANVREIALETNFRSKDEVLQLANHVLAVHDGLIRGNDTENPMDRLVLKGTRGAGGQVEILSHITAEAETRTLFGRVTGLLQQGVPASGIVILARTSFYTSALEIMLRSEGIPVQVWGGRSLLESKTMRDLGAFLKIALYPGQPQHFKRVANLVIGGERTHDEMFLRWKMGLPALEKTEEFMGVIKKLSSLVEEEKNTPGISNCRAIVTLALKNLRDFINPDHNKLPFKEKKEFEAIETALDEIMAKLEAENGGPPQLEEFINHLSLDPASTQTNGDRVTLSTIHQAKGLEWNHVLIAGAHEGKLTFFKNEERTTREETEEECRLLYVAITRAKNTLAITHTGDLIRFLKNGPVFPQAMENYETLDQTHASQHHQPDR